MPYSFVTSRNRPCSFSSTRTGPHSVATTRSGWPSPFRSANTAADTSPIDARTFAFTVSSMNAPLAERRYKRDGAGRGHAPAITRAPTNRSSRPSPFTSAIASAPMLAVSPPTIAVGAPTGPCTGNPTTVATDSASAGDDDS